MKYNVLFLPLALFLFVSPLFIKASAQTYGGVGGAPDTRCPSIYGGGQVCPQAGNILIDKKVSHPKTGTFVDNLTIKDDKFAPDQTVSFRLNIVNTQNSNISKAIVRDIFPQFVNFVSGGNFNSQTRTLTVELNNLKPNESRIVNIAGKVVSKNQLPSDKSIVCVANQAIVAPSNATSKISQDNAQLCIEKVLVAPTQATTKGGQPLTTKGGLSVLPAAEAGTMPATGAETLALIALFPTGAIGYFLRRKSA